MDEQIPGQLDIVAAIAEVMRPLTPAELEYFSEPRSRLHLLAENDDLLLAESA